MAVQQLAGFTAQRGFYVGPGSGQLDARSTDDGNSWSYGATGETIVTVTDENIGTGVPAQVFQLAKEGLFVGVVSATGQGLNPPGGGNSISAGRISFYCQWNAFGEQSVDLGPGDNNLTPKNSTSIFVVDLTGTGGIIALSLTWDGLEEQCLVHLGFQLKQLPYDAAVLNAFPPPISTKRNTGLHFS
jgi:hypothetical protein